MNRILLTTMMMLGLAANAKCQEATSGDAILGIWNAQEKTLKIEIYKAGQEYHAKIVSFTDHHSSVPSADRTDEHNPAPDKKGRKLIGIDVLSGLHYNAARHEWEDGHIYDVSSGSTYGAVASLDAGILSVRAFKGISLIGKTLHFRR